jgi:DNA/RNA endonuclease YhcR with UshA esterase domain
MGNSRSKAVGLFAAMLMTLAAASGCSQTADSPRVLDATDPAAINSAMPTVIVTGQVANVQDSDSVVMINFKGTEKSRFYAVVLGANRQALTTAFGGDIAKAINGKSVRVTGKVVLYRGRPEIIISKADQLVVVGG